MDCSQRDRFELISAFLDGETSPEESQLVRQMLAEDPKARQLYQRLQALRQGLRHLPQPEPSAAPTDLAERVFAVEDRRRYRHAVWWGGSAIAALFVAMVAVSGVIPRSDTQFAKPTVPHDSLLVSLHESLLPLDEVGQENASRE